MDCTACSATSREALVSWDGGEEYAYTGRINEATRWNGFLVPAFTADEVRRMAKETNGVQGLCQITEQPDGSFTIEEADEAWDDDFTANVPPTKCCGLYFIGDWWVWGEVDPELGDLPQNTSAHLTEI